MASPNLNGELFCNSKLMPKLFTQSGYVVVYMLWLNREDCAIQRGWETLDTNNNQDSFKTLQFENDITS